MTRMWVLPIRDMNLPSMNSWLGKHWTVRHDDKTGIEWQVKQAVLELPLIPRPFEKLVDIRVIAHNQTHVHDTDNLPVKALIDGLRYAGVLDEDHTGRVRWVSALLVREKGEPWVGIEIEEVSGE